MNVKDGILAEIKTMKWVIKYGDIILSFPYIFCIQKEAPMYKYEIDHFTISMLFMSFTLCCE